MDTIKVQSAKIAMKNLLSKIPSSSFNFTAHNALFVQTFQAMTGKTPLRADWAATPLNDAGDLSNLWSAATLFRGFESIADLL